MEMSIFVSFVILILKAVLTNESEIETKIVGGEPAHIDDFPHAAYLTIIGPSTAYICGASILNQEFLLTAAHCLAGVKKDVNVSAFVSNAQRDFAEKYDVKTHKIHENWNQSTVTNDIAIVKLARPFSLGKTMTRVAIMENPPVEDVAYVAGWGKDDLVNGSVSKYLKYAKQILWTRPKCLNALNNSLPENVICAGVDRDKFGHAAQGDSGGALIVRGYIQIGLVSFARIYKQEVIVYTDTSKYLKWIQNHTETLYCN